MKLKANTILTISTPTKELCNKVLEALKEKLPLDKRFLILDIEIMEAEAVENTKHFTGHVELDLQFKETSLNGETVYPLENLYNFIYEFSPASIEVYEPSKIDFNLSGLNNTLNTLAGVIVTNSSKNKSLEYSFREFCEGVHTILNNNSKPGKKLRDIEEKLKIYYMPARK